MSTLQKLVLFKVNSKRQNELYYTIHTEKISSIYDEWLNQQNAVGTFNFILFKMGMDLRRRTGFHLFLEFSDPAVGAF
jgi:hypothetical protein